MSHGAHGIELTGPVFAEPVPGSDPEKFGTPHPSDNAIYDELGDLAKKQVVRFPKSRVADDALYTLNDMYGAAGPAVIAKIKEAGRIVIQAVGDTGASDVRKYHDEIRVADQLTTDAHTLEDGNRSAFFFHLGDVVYSFGESRYYYDQFYEPFRAYPAPIVAIAGNHDSFVVPGTPAGQEPLTTFMRNFCAEKPTITPEAGSLHRTAMTAPGVYFAIDAPFIRILALFSNALEDPGVISSENGKWPIDDYQIDFLRTQLQKAKDEQFDGALIIATHHPAFSYRPPQANHASSGNHGTSSTMLAEIDKICSDVGIYPHAFLAAHAHCYQRYTRKVTLGDAEFQVPFVIDGNGGHNVNPLVRSTRNQPAQEPENGSDVSYLDAGPAIKTNGLKLEKYDDHNYGYLRLTADKDQLRIAYHQVGVRSILQSRYDLVTVDLKTHRLTAN